MQTKMCEGLDRLYLFEFLVDKVQLCEAAIQSIPGANEPCHQTCVKFQLLKLPVLEVCEADFCKTEPQPPTNVSFKSGQSCLFSMPDPKRCQVSGICIRVSVVRKPVVKGAPGKCVLVGESYITLPSNFTCLINYDGPQEQAPPSEFVKNIYPLRDGGCVQVGTISLFMRLSNFGNLIITEFQSSPNDPSAYFFKGLGSSG